MPLHSLEPRTLMQVTSKIIKQCTLTAKFPINYIFLIYINDLPLLAGINSKIVLFADDTSTIITSSNQEELKTVLY